MKYLNNAIQYPEHTIDGHNLVFIVGSPRSGTTWLQRLLFCHPQIVTGPETKIFQHNIGPQIRAWRACLDPVEHRGGDGLTAYFTEQEFFGLLRAFLAQLLQPMLGQIQEDELFLEKTPEHGLFMPEILEFLPKSRFIHILRDPRDVVASLLSASTTWGTSWAPKQAKDAARMWFYYVSSIRYSSTALPPWQFFEIRYEELYTSPVPILTACLEFLNLQWDQAGIEHAIADNTPAKALDNGGGTPIPLGGEAAKRSGQAVIEPPGFIRKARPGSWKKDLTLWDRFWTWRVARHLMAECGYAWPNFLFH